MKQKPLPLTPMFNDWIIDFEKAGEVFAEHTHPVEQNHLTLVLRGGIKIVGETKFADQSFHSGDIIVWDAPKSHGFVALTKNTRIVNVTQRR